MEHYDLSEEDVERYELIDLKETVKNMAEEMETLNKYSYDSMNEFADLLEILMDSDSLDEKTKRDIATRFFNKKPNQDGTEQPVASAIEPTTPTGEQASN